MHVIFTATTTLQFYTLSLHDALPISVMESLGERKGEMLNMENTGTGQVRLEFSVPSRGLLGYSTQFMSQTRGYGIMNHSFSHYGPVVRSEERRVGKG